MSKNPSSTPFDRLKEATKQILSVPKKDLPLKASIQKKPKAHKS
jgi:hypothetical protein